MINYIARKDKAELIRKICKDKNMLILYETQEITNIIQYFKETKVNFNLIKYFIIDLSNLDNTEKEIYDSIFNFNKLYFKTRIIILAQGFNAQSNLLNQLYEKGIYNIVNENEEKEIEQKIIKCLSDPGMQKKDAKKFEKVEEVIEKNSKISAVKSKLKAKNNKSKNSEKYKKTENNKDFNTTIHHSEWVYFFALILETATRLIKLIFYIVIFILTSIAITVLMNSQLREIVFQILSLR